MSSVKQTLDRALIQLKKAGGSDLYLEAGAPIMMRIEGQMKALTHPPLSTTFTRQLLEAITTPQQYRTFEETLELNFAYALQNIGRFRVNAFIQRGSPGLVIRAIRDDIPSPESLGLPPSLPPLMHHPQGMILIVGPTGTGKSTTLASLIEHRNRTLSGHIITIEDPIEFVHTHRKCLITQREIGIDTLSYHSALKNALRQAPDIIVIGEIRDRTTMEHALSFAETGHLCLATLHANNAFQALDRIANFFPSDQHEQLFMDLAFNLRAIVSQRLLPRIGGGRIAAFEVLLNTPRVQDLIFKQKVDHLQQVMEENRDRGMQTFDQHLIELYHEGLISYETALRYATSANNVRLHIRLNQGSHPSDTLPPSLSADELPDLSLEI